MAANAELFAYKKTKKNSIAYRYTIMRCISSRTRTWYSRSDELQPILFGIE